jgi:hypothetical protein
MAIVWDVLIGSFYAIVSADFMRKAMAIVEVFLAEDVFVIMVSTIIDFY